MQELIKTITEKAGISESQAKTAVDSVLSFIKDKMPGGIGDLFGPWVLDLHQQ